MSGRRPTSYRCQALAELARQMLFAPPARRVAQVLQAERLHDGIDPGQLYPFDFIYHRITGHHREDEDGADPTLLVGEAVLADLRTLIDQVSRSMGVPTQAGEEVLSVEALAERLHVSTKTLERWRRLGLRWRWTLVEGSRRRRLVYPWRAVQHFVQTQSQRVERATRFTQMNETQRRRLIARARRLASAREVSLNQIATHLARRTGRALETIRQLLEHHDQRFPGEAIFSDHHGPLTVAEQRRIARLRRRGVSVGSLVRQFHRTPTTIHRAVRIRRAMALLRLQIHASTWSAFEAADAEDRFAEPAEALEQEESPEMALVWLELPAAMVHWYRRHPPPGDVAAAWLLRSQYLRYRALRLRSQLDLGDPRTSDMDQVESWIREAGHIRRRLFVALLPLVFAAGRRSLLSDADPTLSRLVERLVTGQRVLAEIIDRAELPLPRRLDALVAWRLQRAFAMADDALDSHRRAHRRLDPADAVASLRQDAATLGMILPMPAPDEPAS